MRGRRFLGRLFAISSKEVRHIARDPRVIYLALGMPIVMLFLFGYGITFDLEKLPVAYVDFDRTPASRRLLDAFAATRIFEPVRELRDPAEVEHLFRRGEVRGGLIIREGYERELKRGGHAQSQLLIDGADNTTAQVAIGYAMGVAQSESQRQIAQAGLQGELPLTGKVRVFFNPEMKSAIFLVPGLIAQVIAVLAALLTALTVAREWERGSMEQLFATPVGRVEVIVGKLLPYLVVGMVQVLLLLTLGTWIFEVPVRGSLWLVLSVALLFLADMLAFGLLISVVTKSQQLAAQIGVVATLLPALLLSGFLFPIENMPTLLQGLSYIVPARYFIDALRSVLLKGGGIAEVWPDFVALGLYALVVTALATLRFKRRIA
jgi:ABC-2 type transport system permease protein